MLPFQIGEFFDQPLYLLLVLDGFPYALFPLPRYEQLAQLSPLPPNQVETGVEFSPSTTTTGFTAAHVAQRKGAAEKAGGAREAYLVPGVTWQLTDAASIDVVPAFTCAAARFSISSGDKSSLWVEIHHVCPNGSSIPPRRSP